MNVYNNNDNLENINQYTRIRIMDSIGLRYKLTDEEMENKYAEVKAIITVYNKCP